MEEPSAQIPRRICKKSKRPDDARQPFCNVFLRKQYINELSRLLLLKISGRRKWVLLCELAHALMNHERDIAEADLQEIVLAALPEDAQPFSKVLSQALVFFLSFPNLVVGLLDFKVYVVHVLRPEPDCSAQWQGLPAPPNPRVSLQCPTTMHPCSAQPRNIPAVPNPGPQSSRKRCISCALTALGWGCSK